jgi:hypothetical protein
MDSPLSGTSESPPSISHVDAPNNLGGAGASSSSSSSSASSSASSAQVPVRNEGGVADASSTSGLTSLLGEYRCVSDFVQGHVNEIRKGNGTPEALRKNLAQIVKEFALQGESVFWPVHRTSAADVARMTWVELRFLPLNEDYATPQGALIFLGTNAYHTYVTLPPTPPTDVARERAALIGHLDPYETLKEVGLGSYGSPGMPPFMLSPFLLRHDPGTRLAPIPFPTRQGANKPVLRCQVSIIETPRNFGGADPNLFLSSVTGVNPARSQRSSGAAEDEEEEVGTEAGPSKKPRK